MSRPKIISVDFIQIINRSTQVVYVPAFQNTLSALTNHIETLWESNLKINQSIQAAIVAPLPGITSRNPNIEPQYTTSVIGFATQLARSLVGNLKMREINSYYRDSTDNSRAPKYAVLEIQKSFTHSDTLATTYLNIFIKRLK